MFSLFGIGFTAPWLLAALVALPILWLILRAIPPAPKRWKFPAVTLLLGLKDDESETDRTPWWLLLLRALAIAALIIGFAGPVLNPKEEQAGDGPLLVLLDASWASAVDWSDRIDRVRAALQDAGRAGRPVATLALTGLTPATDDVPWTSAADELSRLPGLAPAAWEPDYAHVNAVLGRAEGSFDSMWISDGLERPGRAALLQTLSARGSVTVVASPRAALALRPPVAGEAGLTLEVLRSGGAARDVVVAAIGPDPAGTTRTLSSRPLQLAEGQRVAEVTFDMPPELRNRIERFEIVDTASAGAVVLSDDGLRRREVALFTGRAGREGLRLLAPDHYLRQALEPTADLLDGALADVLPANPDVIVLADVATLAPSEHEALQEWVGKGGLLVRFAGPRMAAREVGGADEADPLMPVRLRAGGRSLGGAMSWGDPKSLRAFGQDSPFYGLSIPGDVVVNAQVLAEPDPMLAERTIASLTDGTPLVTRSLLGQGQVVLFHVTANAEWSSLPLSVLFVQMLDRLAASAGLGALEAPELEGRSFVAEALLTGFGTVERAERNVVVDGARLAGARPSAEVPPGLYSDGDRAVAFNVIDAETELAAASWPVGTRIEGLAFTEEEPLKGYLLALALLLLAVDQIAAMWLSGRFGGGMARIAAMLVVGLLVAGVPDGAAAQSDDSFAIEATAQTVLAYVVTGDAEADRISAAGLTGLSDTLFARTSVEPGNPVGIDLERDELALFPILYWPVTQSQPVPSDAAYAKLNTYLRSGGMIVFDTRDGDLPGGGVAGSRLQALALPLDIPPLEPVPSDHVLTRTFYLLQDFPGRYASRSVWVEAAPADAELAEGMPFRNLNDNVTPVLIGGNDWAAAWAVDAAGNWMFPVGRGLGGERQREISLRFGVNLVMHVLTGNYKSDQVHVPALLDRLGQ